MSDRAAAAARAGTRAVLETATFLVRAISTIVTITGVLLAGGVL